jgi:uncharacterized protein Yka (UPF0111/DUF47 family)
MAEALLAFGVAANVVQFIDFTTKVLSTTYRIGQEGNKNLGENRMIQMVNDDLLKSVKNLNKSLKLQESHTLTENEGELMQLAERCKDIASELFSALDSLKSHREHYGRKREKWQNFRIALKTVWKEEHIRRLEGRVDAFRGQLTMRILISLR